MATAAMTTATAMALTLGSAVAQAAPDFDPCANSGVFFCRMLPIMPELDEDVDLSTPAPPASPAPSGTP